MLDHRLSKVTHTHTPWGGGGGERETHAKNETMCVTLRSHVHKLKGRRGKSQKNQRVLEKTKKACKFFLFIIIIIMRELKFNCCCFGGLY